MELVLKNVESGNFKNLNMNFKEGKITCIYDEDNSNLLELLALLKKCDKGFIKFDDFIYNNKTNKISKEIRKKIGFVSRLSENHIFNKTVKKELELSLKLFNQKANIDTYAQVMKMLDLDIEFLNRDPFTLSTGEKRKLALAMVLVYNPDVIIVEDPFILLDFDSRKKIYELLNKLRNAYNKTIIYSTNDIENIYKIADYIYFFKDYSIVLEGNKNIILKDKDLLIKNNILLPQVISFSDYVLDKKNIKLGYRYEINDLIKDIYRNAR